MIRRPALFLVLMLAAASPGIACVCVGPFSQEQRREAAQRIARDAVAVAEIELAEPMNYQAMRAELYRVHKVHVGDAPSEFRLARDFSRGPGGQVQTVMTSCDIIPPAGERTTVVLFATSSPATYRIGSTCDHMFINSPGAVDLVREEARKLAGDGERG